MLLDSLLHITKQSDLKGLKPTVVADTIHSVITVQNPKNRYIIGSREEKNISSNHAKQRTNARLLIVDTIMPYSNEPFIGKFIDILMLALTHNGRIRSEKEFRKLLKGSGFDTVNIIRSPDPANFLSIIEAIPSN